MSALNKKPLVFYTGKNVNILRKYFINFFHLSRTISVVKGSNRFRFGKIGDRLFQGRALMKHWTISLSRTIASGISLSLSLYLSWGNIYIYIQIPIEKSRSESSGKSKSELGVLCPWKMERNARPSISTTIIITESHKHTWNRVGINLGSISCCPQLSHNNKYRSFFSFFFAEIRHTKDQRILSLKLASRC